MASSIQQNVISIFQNLYFALENALYPSMFNSFRQHTKRIRSRYRGLRLVGRGPAIHFTAVQSYHQISRQFSAQAWTCRSLDTASIFEPSGPRLEPTPQRRKHENMTMSFKDIMMCTSFRPALFPTTRRLHRAASQRPEGHRHRREVRRDRLLTGTLLRQSCR